MRPLDYARRLYKHLDLKTPPVNLVAVLKAVDISVQQDDLAGHADGYAVQMNERPLIIVDRKLALGRKRWTIAHELAHCLIPEHRGKLARNGRDRRREREADIFARELLMPAPLVKKWWKESRSSGRDPDVKQMAWDFQVSRTAMSIRLEELGLAEGML